MSAKQELTHSPAIDKNLTPPDFPPHLKIARVDLVVLDDKGNPTGKAKPTIMAMAFKEFKTNDGNVVSEWCLVNPDTGALSVEGASIGVGLQKQDLQLVRGTLQQLSGQ